MKEVTFVRQNVDKWRQTNQMLKSIREVSPEQVASVYQDIAADLSFARTHYPDSEVVPLLNALSLRLHNHIYGYRPQRLRRIWLFWSQEIPLEVYRRRKYILASLLIVLLSALLGCLSTLADADFARTVMGDGYIDMTLRNIENGNPMGVYGNANSYSMMYGITLNNIRVSFIVYAMGVLTYFFSGLILAYNGIMIGTFMAFCHLHGVLTDLLMAMWLHGVFEITALVVAGGAGLTLGCGWMFPASLPRLTSFRLHARSSLKIIIGLVPFFIVAGFIESFITRHTHAPFALRLSLIVFSVAFVLFYFVWMPYHKRHAED